jgi:hypothetical protein
MQLTLIFEDPNQLLLPFPDVTWRPPAVPAALVPDRPVDHRWRSWTHEPRGEELAWSGEDLQEAA